MMSGIILSGGEIKKYNLSLNIQSMIIHPSKSIH